MQHRKIILSSLLAIGGLTLGAGASAQLRAPENSDVLGAYGSISVGRAHSNVGGSEIGNALSRQGVSGSTSVDDNDTGYGLRLGYRFHPNFAVEGGYTDLGRFDYNTALTGGGNATGRLKADAWDLSAVGIVPFANNFSGYGKVGVARTRAERESNTAGISGATERGTHPTAGLGVAYDFTKQLAATAEWNRYFKVGDQATTGRGDIDLYSVGLKYKF